MYRSFNMRNFRGFENLTLGPLERINLIAGKNNVGKTSLLEAMWIHHAPSNPDVGLRVDSFRGVDIRDPEDFLSNLFFNFDRELVVELSAEGNWGSDSRSLEMYLQTRATVEVPLSEFEEDQLSTQQRSSAAIRESSSEIVMDYVDETGKKVSSSGWLVERQIRPGVFATVVEKRQQRSQERPQAIFLAARRPLSGSEDAERYSKLEINGQHDGVISILREIDPRVSRMAVVSLKGVPTIFADIGVGRLLPLPLMGDGMVRISSLALAIANAPNGAVMVDEIENGLHHTVMQKVWRAIAAFARVYDVQIFATTHSDECIRSAHKAFEADENYDFRLHRLDRVNGTIRSVNYDQEMLSTALEAGLEVR